MEAEKIKQWYVVHAYSGHESFVMREIKARASSLKLEDKISEVVVPSEEVVEMRAGKKRKSTRRFFPGYVLVNMLMDDETWHMIRAIPKVLGFIGGTSDHPAAITEKKINSIM